MSIEVNSERLLAVFGIVESALDDPCLDPTVNVGYTREHINRLLISTIGEPTKALTLRLRLERAAYRIQVETCSVTDAAYEAGYSDIEPFIKAFRLKFGISPGRMRSHGLEHTCLPSLANIHWRISKPPRIQLDEFTTVSRRPPRKMAAKLTIGDYREIPGKWRSLATELPTRLTESVDFHAASLFHDDGMKSADRDRMRAHLGFVLNDMAPPSGFEVVELPGGVYLSSQAAESSADHYRLWSSLNANWVSKEQVRRPAQPGFDEYEAIPAEWERVRATISLAVPRFR